MQHSALLQQFTQYVPARVLEQTNSLGCTYCDKKSWEETKGTSHARARGQFFQGNS